MHMITIQDLLYTILKIAQLAFHLAKNYYLLKCFVTPSKKKTIKVSSEMNKIIKKLKLETFLLKN